MTTMWGKRATKRPPSSINDAGTEEAKRMKLQSNHLQAGGIIELEMKNFMNHEQKTCASHVADGRVCVIVCVGSRCASFSTMTVSFGRSGIYYITGMNGSGKSAVTTALQVILGIRTSKTFRGTNLSDLVNRNTTGPAVLTLTLSNDGKRAYKPNTYGVTITIIRTITRDRKCNNKYELRGAQGGETTSKEEWDKVVSHFFYKNDNPALILNQDDSKKLLGNATGSFLYKTFNDTFNHKHRVAGFDGNWQLVSQLADRIEATNNGEHMSLTDIAGGIVQLEKEQKEAKVQIIKMRELEARAAESTKLMTKVEELKNELTDVSSPARKLPLLCSH